MTSTTETAFQSFHRLNPFVYEQLKALALRLKKVGVKKYGMKALFEILRFNALLSVDNKIKLSNNYTSLYARLLMQQEPELAGFFVTRTLR
jgi:hypothetical protein